MLLRVTASMCPFALYNAFRLCEKNTADWFMQPQARSISVLVSIFFKFAVLCCLIQCSKTLTPLVKCSCLCCIKFVCLHSQFLHFWASWYSIVAITTLKK